jgi:hypothetical protein
VNTGKSERMEGQKSFLTASGSAGPVNVRLCHYFDNGELSLKVLPLCYTESSNDHSTQSSLISVYFLIIFYCNQQLEYNVLYKIMGWLGV